MKKMFYLGLIAAAVFFFYPAKPNSGTQSFQDRLKSLVKTEDSHRHDLERKRAELAAYEKGLVDITASMEKMIENAPICPTTGDRATVTITKDPRDEMQVKIETLREEIRFIEQKLKG